VAEEMHRFADELRAGFRELEELLHTES
jgi:hypothetical protein